MVFVLVNFIVAILAVLALVVLLLNSKGRKHRNVYFLVILAVCLFVRSVYVWEFFTGDGTQIIFPNLGLTYFVLPVYYFFFKQAYGMKIKASEQWLVFAVAAVFSFVHMLSAFPVFVNKYIYLGYSFVALAALVWISQKAMASRNVFHVSSRRKNWLIMMLVLSVHLIFTSNISYFIPANESQESIAFFFKVSSLIWLVVLVYLFLNPEVLYGTVTLDKIVKENQIVVFSSWTSSPSRDIGASDLKIHKRLKDDKNKIIVSIDQLITEEIAKGTVIQDMQQLKKALNIPMAHLEYVFKYYCKYSKNDFFNYVKVQYAISLLEAGYLDTKTIDTLVTDSFFNSKTTFYNNFKKFTGKRPLELYME